MSNWKKELKESIEPSVNFSQYDLQEIIEQAKEYKACKMEIHNLEQFDSIKDASASLHAPFWCTWYAVHVIQGRWREAEHIIMKNASDAYTYTRTVIKKRWIEAEPIIMKNAGYAYQYSCFAIKERWLEAEPFIAKDFYWKREYERYFDCKIFLLEKRI